MQDQIIKNNTTGEAPNEPGIMSKAIESGKWMVAGYILQKIIGLLSFLVLVRFLTPTDFGIVATMLIVPNFLLMVTEAGFGSATIQRKGDIEKYLDPIWTIGLLKSILIAFVMIIAGPYIAHFYHTETAQLAIQLGGLLILIGSLGNAGETYLFKDMNFKKIFIRNIVRDLTYIIVSLAVIFWSHSYWALIAGTFASYAVQTILSYKLHPYRPSISLKLGVLRDLFGYGKWVAIQGWIGQIYGLLENSAVVRITGVASMGMYSKAKNLASIAPGFLMSIITPISFPAYAKIINSREKIRDGFVKSLHLVFFILIPAIILMIAGGGKIILVLLGSQWLPMTNALRIFLLFYLFNTVVGIIYALLNGIGHPAAKTKLEIIKISVTIACIFYLASHYNIAGAAFALLLGIIPVFFMGMYYLKKLTDITFRDIFITINIPLCISVILLIPAILLRNKILHLNSIILLLLLIMVGLLYVLLTYLIGKRTNHGPFPTLKLISKHTHL